MELVSCSSILPHLPCREPQNPTHPRNPLQIRVFCRIRPNPRSAVQCLPDGLSVRLAGPDGKEHSFGYDKVFRPEASQVGCAGGMGARMQPPLQPALCLHGRWLAVA